MGVILTVKLQDKNKMLVQIIKTFGNRQQLRADGNDPRVRNETNN
jgi:hypothetical protein